ncbi:hypothetical protein CDAR_270511 [Caerostris darwini]|uniref:Uncharacterized protein n=1 Tax=Caerostris darwini TaxID=1538125 RepID=A0AAV4NK16_9ARAC|nr:hypothetical protein CDAR_270511 [Caerostris darwini]
MLFYRVPEGFYADEDVPEGSFLYEDQFMYEKFPLIRLRLFCLPLKQPDGCSIPTDFNDFLDWADAPTPTTTQPVFKKDSKRLLLDEDDWAERVIPAAGKDLSKMLEEPILHDTIHRH